MDAIYELKLTRKERPIKVLQFGEGNFLRAFVDYFIDKMNASGDFDGNVAIVKSVPFGTLEPFYEQNNFYTVYLEGEKNGAPYEERRIITSIGDAVDIFTDYERYISYARSKDLEIILSNTTEAGIVYRESDEFGDKLNVSYPAKLTQFLYERWMSDASDNGLHILACELVDDNGAKLHECVMRYVKLWGLEEEFASWIEEKNVFCTTLVDRIVTGSPRARAKEYADRVGYLDSLFDIAEPFGLWVIENKGRISELLGSSSTPEIIFTSDVKPYKVRKVRLLNAVHTCMVPPAFLTGNDNVLSAVTSPVMGKFISEIMDEELGRTVALPEAEIKSFSNSVVSRFRNTALDHRLLSISLNSVSKYRERVLDAMHEYVAKFGKLPQRMLTGLAFLIKMYSNGSLVEGKLECDTLGRNYVLSDSPEVLAFFAGLKGESIEKIGTLALRNVAFWGEDLTEVDGLEGFVLSVLKDIDEIGAEETVIKYAK